MTAGLELCLALIEADLVPDLAKAVARKLVVYHRRDGEQRQFSTLLELLPRSDRIQAALHFARETLHRPLTVPDLAEAAHLSPRQFSRAFQDETGQSPAKAVEALRLETARELMPPPAGPSGADDGLQRRRPHAPRLPARLRPPPRVLRRQTRA